MTNVTRRITSRTLTAAVLLLLLLVVLVALYLYLEERLRPLAPRVAAGELSGEAMRVEMFVLLLLVLGAALLILVFVLAAYIVLRLGRAIADKRVGGQPTAYRDAWSEYRLTDEQIAAATSEDSGNADGGTEDRGR
jgi:hypothetical protein